MPPCQAGRAQLGVGDPGELVLVSKMSTSEKTNNVSANHSPSRLGQLTCGSASL